MNTGKLGIIGAVVVLIVGLYFYNQHLQSEIETLESNNAKLEMGISAQKSIIDNMQMDIIEIQSINKNISNVQKQQKEEISEIQGKFSNSSSGKERSIGELAVAKPQLIENIINDATNDVNECFEQITGDGDEKC